MSKAILNSKDQVVRVARPDRSQMETRWQFLDEILPADHAARVIWRVVETLDLRAFYAPIQAVVGGPGRDAIDPRLLVGVWLYATIDGVGSAREVDRLCRESDPYKWLVGGVSLNYHTLADFRVQHADALDALFTRVVASLVDRGLVGVSRISQDGLRMRACAGASSFRRKARLEKLLEEARRHVADLRACLEDPERAAALSARKKSAQERAARERQERIEAALAALPELQDRQAKLARKVSQKDRKAGKLKEPRASTTDDQARVMKMPDGGFRPGVNVQFAVDTGSRTIVGVEVTSSGVDAGQSEPMRRQVEARTGRKVREHLYDGGYLKFEEIETAAAQGVRVYCPPKPPRNPELRGSQYEPRPDDSPVIKDWRALMGSPQGKTIYKERAATVETVNADARAHRGLDRLLVRGLRKARCVALWFALGYNVMHFARQLIG